MIKSNRKFANALFKKIFAVGRPFDPSTLRQAQGKQAQGKQAQGKQTQGKQTQGKYASITQHAWAVAIS
jgi:hypothetical protein